MRVIVASLVLFASLWLLPASPRDAAPRDTRAREYVKPVKVVWQSENPAAVSNPERLLNPFSGQITLGGGPACVLRHNGEKPGVVLDFGRELHGGLEIAVSDLKSLTKESKTVRLRVRFGESVSEAMSELGGDKNATNDHATRDQIVNVPWLGSIELGNSGFRFVQIDLVDEGSMVALKAVRAIYVHSGLPTLGSFRCSDPRLEEIWRVGAYTVYLNVQDYVWDGIKRDRLVWIGDLHPETSTIAATLGAVPQVPASLDLIREETPLPGWMNGLSSYSIWWIIIHRDWFLQTGDLAYLRQQHSYLKGLVGALAAKVGPDGREQLDARFLDWPSSGNEPAIHAGLQSLMVLAFKSAGDLAKALGDEPLAARCSAQVTSLRRHVPAPGNSKQAAALMALAGLGNPADLNASVLAKEGSRGLSTFYGYYVLQARAAAGDYQGALENIREYWGAMLGLGATTFWEDFNLDWTNNAARIDAPVPPGKKDIHGDYGAHCYIGFRHSLCHGWASGPTAWLSQHVLGVEVTEPGGKVVRVRPHLGDLDWAEGDYPTPLGVVKVRHEQGRDGKIKSKISAPKGVRIER